MRFLIAFLLASTLAYAGDLTHRQGTVTIKTVDRNGLPISRSLSIVGEKSSFSFGANSGSIQDWPTFGTYLGVFNSVSLLTFWSSLSSSAGEYDKARVDSSVFFMNTFADNGLVVNAHPILYNFPVAQPANATVDHYAAHLDWWKKTFTRVSVVDVVNEPYHHPTPITWPLFDSLKDSGLVRRINEYGLLTGEITDEWVNILKANSDKFDVIGIQAHIFAPQSQLPSLSQIKANLLKLTAIGKPVHITEISVPSNAYGWTEASQASYLKSLYTLFFETPGVEGIFYWDLSDKSSWNPSSGLWRADGSLKPAWTTLSTLLKKTWMTSKRISVPKSGVPFTGFKGTYLIDGTRYVLEPGATWTIKSK